MRIGRLIQLTIGALFVLASALPSLALAGDDGDSSMRGEESYRSFPQLMMRQSGTYTLPETVAAEFESNLQAALGLWRYEIVEYGPDSPDLLTWCNRITADLQTYRKELDGDTNEAELTIDAKEFQCSESYSYQVDVKHSCRTTGTAGDATRTRWAYCKVDATIGFRKYRAKFDESAPVIGTTTEAASLVGGEAAGQEYGRMMWAPQSDWGKGGSITIRAKDEQRVEVKPGKQAESIDEALKWALVTVLSKAAGMLSGEPDLKPKAMVQGSKGSDVNLCLSKDIVKLDAPFLLYDEKGRSVGFMKARDLHDGCELTPTLERDIKNKRRKRIKRRTRLKLDPLGKKGKAIDAPIDDNDWDRGFMRGQLITGDAVNRFGMGHLAQEIPYSGYNMGAYGGVLLNMSDEEADPVTTAGLTLESSLADAFQISEFYLYGHLGADLGESVGAAVEAGLLKRSYLSGPLFVDVSAGIAGGYYTAGDGAALAGAAANLGLGLALSPGFAIRVRAGYRGGMLVGLGDEGESAMQHNVGGGLNLNLSL
jgi:hypothetical protein